jgi:hypothetical protein
VIKHPLRPSPGTSLHVLHLQLASNASPTANGLHTMGLATTSHAFLMAFGADQGASALRVSYTNNHGQIHLPSLAVQQHVSEDGALFDITVITWACIAHLARCYCAAAGSCSGSPGPEWADSGCGFTHVGSKCIVSCSNGQQGIGFVAECTMRGWQVTARDCANVTPPEPEILPKACGFLPSPNAPLGSKGWAADCAGRDHGQTCKAACDGINSYFGRGYTALCQDGHWKVQPGGTCEGKGHNTSQYCCCAELCRTLHLPLW